jgi:hypothetical protein
MSPRCPDRLGRSGSGEDKAVGKVAVAEAFAGRGHGAVGQVGVGAHEVGTNFLGEDAGDLGEEVADVTVAALPGEYAEVADDVRGRVAGGQGEADGFALRCFGDAPPTTAATPPPGR